MTLLSPIEIGAIGSALIVGAGLVFFFLKALQLAMMLGIAGAACLAVAGLLNGYVGTGKAEQLAIDAPLLEAKVNELAVCATDKKTAIDANATLQLGVEKLKGILVDQNKAVEDITTKTDKAVADAHAAQALNARKIAALESDTNMVFRNAAGALKNLTCDQREKKYSDFVHDIAVREYADRPPKAVVPAAGLSVK